MKISKMERSVAVGRIMPVLLGMGLLVLSASLVGCKGALPKAGELEHVAVVVPDLEKTLDWWTQNLGCKMVMRRAGGSAFVTDSSGRIAFEVYGPHEGCPAPDYSKMPITQLHFGFYSDDVDLDVKRLTEAGATLVVRESAPGLEGALLRDPSGFPIQFVKRDKAVAD